MRFILAILLAVCLPACHGTADAPDVKKGCKEFEYHTTRNGKPVVCQMVWCEEPTWDTSLNVHYTGGAAVLWCDEEK